MVNLPPLLDWTETAYVLCKNGQSLRQAEPTRIRQTIHQSVSELLQAFYSRGKRSHEQLPVAHTEKTNPLLYSTVAVSASDGRGGKASSCLRTAGPWGRSIRQHVKSMRVFLFPDFVFPCLLILPLSGVSAQVSFQVIGPDWDGRNSWSALTCSPMILFLSVTVQTEKQTWLFWSVRANTLRCLSPHTEIKR